MKATGAEWAWSVCCSITMGECSQCDYWYFTGGEEFEAYTEEWINTVIIPHMEEHEHE